MRVFFSPFRTSRTIRASRITCVGALRWELYLDPDDAPVGLITSAAYGHSIGRSVGFGYVQEDEPFLLEALKRKRFEIEVGDERFAARVSTRAVHDPANRDIR